MSTHGRVSTLPRWYALAAIILAMLMLGIGSYAYTNHVDRTRAAAEREADRRWCQLLVTLDKAYSTVTPASELGRLVAAAIHSLRIDLDC